MVALYKHRPSYMYDSCHISSAAQPDDRPSTSPNVRKTLSCLLESFATYVPQTHSFIHSGYFCSTSSSLLLLRGAPHCGSASVSELINTPKRYRQLRVRDLPKVPTWRLESDSNLRPSGRKASNLLLSHHTSQSAS